jgi:hypothetical protein
MEWQSQKSVAEGVTTKPGKPQRRRHEQAESQQDRHVCLLEPLERVALARNHAGDQGHRRDRPQTVKQGPTASPRAVP